MNGALRIAIPAVLILAFMSAGCATTVSAEEFLTRYKTNIAVPNPDSHNLPIRTFLGQRRGNYLLEDRIPFSQGGGLLGTYALWSCPVESLPANFPAAVRPGDCIVDGRSGAKYKYVIQRYMDTAGKAPK